MKTLEAEVQEILIQEGKELAEKQNARESDCVDCVYCSFPDLEPDDLWACLKYASKSQTEDAVDFP
jgi:uncharacterized protein (DUF433 family)